MNHGPVEVVPGALAELAARVDAHRPGFVVTDRNVAPLLPASLDGLPRHVLVPGEASKSWSGLGRLLEDLDRARIDRDGCLLAVGGGVVTDLAGLAASLHRRGIAWVAVPTSLVGQVDAAVGGKTAVDQGGGKNTVGSFHPPARVLVDPRALASLERRHLQAGFAELLKTALITGGALYEGTLAALPDDFAAARPAAVTLIEGCLRAKLDLVRRDPYDHGERRLLNLGHTFGHAFEALALPGLLHGEAVALGLLCAARLAGATDLEAELRAVLRRWDLPITRSAPPAALLEQMTRDKKRAGGRLTLVRVRDPGVVELVEGVEPARVEQALEAVLVPD